VTTLRAADDASTRTARSSCEPPNIAPSYRVGACTLDTATVAKTLDVRDYYSIVAIVGQGGVHQELQALRFFLTQGG